MCNKGRSKPYYSSFHFYVPGVATCFHLCISCLHKLTSISPAFFIRCSAKQHILASFQLQAAIFSALVSIGCREKVYVDMQKPFLNLHEVCNAHAHNQYTAKLLNIGRFLIADPIIGATLEVTVCVRWM